MDRGVLTTPQAKERGGEEPDDRPVEVVVRTSG